MPIGREHFFYVRQGNYDDLAERSLPHYQEAHDLIAQVLGAHRSLRAEPVSSAIDLGTGSGFTAAMLLHALPEATVTGVDLFPEMIEQARRRLANSASRVRLVVSDNSEFLRGTSEKFDVVTTAFCIHHLDASGKQDIFRRIFDVLRPGGVFVLLDLTTFSDSILRKIARKATEGYMLSRVTDEKARAEWLHHWNNINVPDPADDQVGWMRAAGFRAETVCRWLEVALLAGIRDANR